MTNLINLFNHLLTLILGSFLLLFSSHFRHPIPNQMTNDQLPITSISTPSAKLNSVPTSSLVAPSVNPPKKYIQTSQPVPWGTTEKIGEHLYRTYVADDPSMGTPDEILKALNNYRHIHGSGDLHSDDKLCSLAKMRADQQEKISTLDSHKGLIEYMNDPKHWEELNIKAIGENASYGYILSGTHLIEWVFDSDPEHRENQLNPSWNLGCAGISGVTVDIIFGKR